MLRKNTGYLLISSAMRELTPRCTDHGSFTYAPEPRRDLGDHCEDLNNTYTWTIPEDIDVREPQFRIVVVDGVNLDVLAASDSFHIRSDNVGSGGDGTDVPTITTLALPGLPEGTYSPGFQPGEGAVEPAGAGFSTGVRAALGVGVGILVVVLALGVLLIRRRRFDLCTRRARLRGKMCHIAELEDSPPRRKDDRVATKEKVYELPGTPVD